MSISLDLVYKHLFLLKTWKKILLKMLENVNEIVKPPCFVMPVRDDSL